jgi:hypothetical protein
MGDERTSTDPTTVALLAQSAERDQLRAENLRLSQALVAAYTEVEVLKAERDRLPIRIAALRDRLRAERDRLPKRGDAVPVETEVDVAIRLATLMVVNSAGERDSVLVLARAVVAMSVVVDAVRRIAEIGCGGRHLGHATGADDLDVPDWILDALVTSLMYLPTAKGSP